MTVEIMNLNTPGNLEDHAYVVSPDIDGEIIGSVHLNAETFVRCSYVDKETGEKCGKYVPAEFHPKNKGKKSKLRVKGTTIDVVRLEIRVQPQCPGCRSRK